VNTAV